MPYVDSKEPLESKLNWLGILTAAVAALTGLLNSEWVASNPKLTMIITAVVGVLTVVIRTFFTHGPTTLTKAVIVFALAIGAASTAVACAPGDIAISKAEGEEITRELQAKAAMDRANAAEATHNAWGRIPTDGSKQYQPTLAGNGVPYPVQHVAFARAVRVCDGTACKVTAEPTINLSPAQARWFRAMPLPWIERRVIAVIFGL